MASPPKSQLRASLTTYRRPTSRGADALPQHIVPDRWSPFGWKYVTSPEHRPAFFKHRYARERKRAAPRTESPSRFQTTNQSYYPSHSPDLYRHKPGSRNASARRFPPLPSDRQFIDNVLGSSTVNKSPSMPLHDWAADWATRGAFHKKRHLDTEWIRMYLSSGTIK